MAKKRAKQGHLKGMEPPSIPEIDSAAEAYVDARDGRMAASKEEGLAHDRLMILMAQHGLVTYEYDSKVVSVVEAKKVRVRQAKDAQSNGEDE